MSLLTNNSLITSHFIQSFINFELRIKHLNIYTRSNTSRDLNLGLKSIPARNMCGFSILQCYMVLRTAAQLLECGMECPMRNAPTCLLFNLLVREIEESHCRNTNVVTKEYCCVMWWTIQGETHSFHVTDIVHFISAHKDLCSLLCSYCAYWITLIINQQMHLHKISH